MDALVDFARAILVGDNGYQESCTSPYLSINLHLVTTPPLFAKVGTEGYTLVVDEQSGAPRISISAAAEHGVFNGMMTALQLLLQDSPYEGTPAEEPTREATILAQTIQDYPDHPIRGAKWDLVQKARSGVSGPYSLGEATKRRIDFLARHKVDILFYAHNSHELRDLQPRGR
jgi:hypothetical protein